MKNNVLVPVVLVLIVLGGVLVLTRKSSSATPPEMMTEQTTPTPTPTPTMARPQPPVAGDVFANSSIKSMAYQVFPGKLSDSAVIATKGWAIKSTLQKDGSTKVDFIPSEQADQAKSYAVKKGDTLYFVEVNPGDDTESKDMFLQDDYGVLVGADGMVK